MRKKKRSNRDVITASKVLLEGELEAFTKAIPTGDSVEERREALILWIVVNSGMRASELCDLRPCDTPVALGLDVIEVFNGKNGSLRDVPVMPEFSLYIEDYIQSVRPRTLPRRYARSSREGWLFYDSRKKKYNRHQIRRLVQKTAKKAGIQKNVTTHYLRHTFATNAVLKGKSLIELKVLMGHTDIKATEKYLNPAFRWDVQTAEILNHFPKGLMKKKKE